MATQKVKSLIIPDDSESHGYDNNDTGGTRIGSDSGIAEEAPKLEQSRSSSYIHPGTRSGQYVPYERPKRRPVPGLSSTNSGGINSGSNSVPTAVPNVTQAVLKTRTSSLSVNSLSAQTSGRIPGVGPPSPTRSILPLNLPSSPTPSASYFDYQAQHRRAASTSSLQTYSTESEVDSGYRQSLLSQTSIGPPPAIPDYSPSRRTSFGGPSTGLGAGIGAHSTHVSISSLNSVSSFRSAPSAMRTTSTPAETPSSVGDTDNLLTPVAYNDSTPTTATTTSAPESLRTPSIASSFDPALMSGATTDSPLPDSDSFLAASISTTADLLLPGNVESNAPSADLRAYYVLALRRQRATVWCGRAQKAKPKTSTTTSHKDKDKTKKGAEKDEFISYANPYSFYQPKLDMTLELSDARAVVARSSRMAARASGRGEGEDSGESGLHPAPSTTSASTSEDKSAGDHDSVTSGVSRHSSLDPRIQNNIDRTEIPEFEDTNYQPTEEQTSLRRPSSADTLDESRLVNMYAPRRTLYIANPDYSSDD
ncbi:uncharacterized protein V1516DRAFT_679592 [Lipomyces oligophaga]|uniref:uncharacterized protein n=1 Tax=Lipomyces oligophaga TaxID=45792 RepID=UPI0034CF0EE6